MTWFGGILFVVWVIWWVRGSIWPGVILFLIATAAIIEEHASYMFEANAPHRAYLALQQMCPAGAIQPCDYVKTFDGSLMQTISIGGEAPARDGSLPIFGVVIVVCAIISFIPHLLARRRARQIERTLHGVSFLAVRD